MDGTTAAGREELRAQLHFIEISKDRLVYVGERGQNRIEVFTTAGKFVKEFSVSPNTPSDRADGICGGPNNTG